MALRKREFANLDADESIFFLRQLESVMAESYDVLYPEFRARDLIPIDRRAGPGAQSITYRQYDQLGMAKVIANYATDLPRVDLKGKEFTAQVRSLGLSYGYSLQDVRSAQFAGIPLEQRKANAAKRAAYQLEDDIAMKGDSTHNLGGLFSNPNITDVAAPNNAGATSTLWVNKTAAEILKDLFTLANTPVDASLGVELPDTLILPLAQHSLVATTQMPNTTMTVLEFFLKNHPYVKNCEVWNRLKGAGSGATDVAMVYRKSPDKLSLQVPQEFEQLPVQEHGLEFEIPCHMRTGGVIIYYPLSIAIMHLI